MLALRLYSAFLALILVGVLAIGVLFIGQIEASSLQVQPSGAETDIRELVSRDPSLCGALLSHVDKVTRVSQSDFSDPKAQFKSIEVLARLINEMAMYAPLRGGVINGALTPLQEKFMDYMVEGDTRFTRYDRLRSETLEELRAVLSASYAREQFFDELFAKFVSFVSPDSETNPLMRQRDEMKNVSGEWGSFKGSASRRKGFAQLSPAQKQIFLDQIMNFVRPLISSLDQIDPNSETGKNILPLFEWLNFVPMVSQLEPEIGAEAKSHGLDTKELTEVIVAGLSVAGFLSLLKTAVELDSAIIFESRRLVKGHYWIVTPRFQAMITFDVKDKPTKLTKVQLFTESLATFDGRYPLIDTQPMVMAPATKSYTPISTVARNDQVPSAVESPEAPKPTKISKAVVYFEAIDSEVRSVVDQLNLEYPGSENFLATWASIVQSDPELRLKSMMDSLRFKTVYLLKKFSGETETQEDKLLDILIRLKNGRELQSQGNTQGRNDKKEPAAELNALLSLEDVSVDSFEAGRTYTFRFIDAPDVGLQRVVISKEVLEFMRVNRFGVRWLRYLLRRSNGTSSGIKPLHQDSLLVRQTGATHEIKIGGSSNNHRIAVVFDSVKKVYRLLRSFDKDSPGN